MKDNKIEILVNMPNCSNLRFQFIDNKIISSKKNAFKNDIDTLSFYSLSEDVQNTIGKFLNPKAI